MTKILLVEDDPFLRTELQEILTARGYAVTAVECGRLALKAQAEDNHQIVLTDIVMADGEGIELIRALRKRDPGLMIIAMSAMQNYLENAEKLGADRSLLKPFTARELLACLEDAA